MDIDYKLYYNSVPQSFNFSVYHTFHDEVELYKQHWWRCDGPCTKKPPFYGFVKRPMNRAPGPNDRWWGQHQQTCGGSFIKVKEPEGYGQKKGKKKTDNKETNAKKTNDKSDIRKFFGDNSKTKAGSGSSSKKPKGLWDANNVPKAKPSSNGVSCFLTRVGWRQF